MDNFVLTHTRSTTLPFLPELNLRLADEVIPVWQESERDAPPFWAFAWPGGTALARFVLDHPELVRGRRVLDLASGCGVVAIAAARCGAASVVATEIDEYAAAAIEHNARVNGVPVRVHLGDVLDSNPDSYPDQVDVILAGDVFYSRDMSLRVLAFLQRWASRPVYVGDPGRAYAPKSGFERVAEYDVPVNRDVEDSDHKHTAILRKIAI